MDKGQNRSMNIEGGASEIISKKQLCGLGALALKA